MITIALAERGPDPGGGKYLWVLETILLIGSLPWCGGGQAL